MYIQSYILRHAALIEKAFPFFCRSSNFQAKNHGLYPVGSPWWESKNKKDTIGKSTSRRANNDTYFSIVAPSCEEVRVLKHFYCGNDLYHECTAKEIV